MFKLFIAGGAWFMAILTIVLVLVFFAAWKAPRWVKEIGEFALAFGGFSTILGLMQMFSVIQQSAVEVQQCVVCGGLKVGMIPVLYGIIIYLVSLVIRILQKPRL